MNTYEQLHLDFHASATDGYATWQWGLAEAEARIAAAYALPLNAVVRVTLRNLDQEFVGALKLRSRPANANGREPLELRIGGMPFLHTEIESCTVLTGT